MRILPSNRWLECPWEKTIHPRKGQRNHHIPKKECEGHELPESQAADSAATSITLILLSLYVPITRISIEALVWGNNFGQSTITTTTIKKHGLEIFKTIISSSYIRNQNEQHPHDSDDHRSHQTPGPDSSVSEKFSYFCHSYKQGDRRDPVREMTNRFLIKLIVILLATIPVKDNCVFIKKISRSRYLIDLMRCLFLSFTFCWCGSSTRYGNLIDLNPSIGLTT
ncbi:hypothetical protein H4Q26_008562 [Puccinia striiformis f. sp. tritici PST-130]|nr:hypothetical protein H4Q26_008562 [Puccinia striiformis f. sp. tritici PST-130]